MNPGAPAGPGIASGNASIVGYWCNLLQVHYTQQEVGGCVLP